MAVSMGVELQTCSSIDVRVVDITLFQSQMVAFYRTHASSSSVGELSVYIGRLQSTGGRQTLLTSQANLSGHNRRSIEFERKLERFVKSARLELTSQIHNMPEYVAKTKMFQASGRVLSNTMSIVAALATCALCGSSGSRFRQ